MCPPPANTYTPMQMMGLYDGEDDVAEMALLFASGIRCPHWTLKSMQSMWHDSVAVFHDKGMMMMMRVGVGVGVVGAMITSVEGR